MKYEVPENQTQSEETGVCGCRKRGSDAIHVPLNHIEMGPPLSAHEDENVNGLHHKDNRQ